MSSTWKPKSTKKKGRRREKLKGHITDRVFGKSPASLGLDVISSRQVLRDAYASVHKFERAKTRTDRRLYWVLAITLLRAVGHVLHKTDAERSTFLNEAVSYYYSLWKANPLQNAIFTLFIEQNRNEILKEYSIDPTVEEYADYVLVGTDALKPEKALELSLEWWEAQLAMIEDRAQANYARDSI